MSHEIMKTEDGTFAMAYREGDALPWHAAETNPQTFARSASPQAVSDAARLGYQVQLVPNCRPDGSPIADSFHISRADDPATVLRAVRCRRLATRAEFQLVRIGRAYLRPARF
jgi:hypothetical protein